MKKNLLVAQSGGPTAAINATLAGVIKQAIKEEQIDQVYGACYGIQGVLEQKFVNLTEKVDTEEKLEKLKRTPAAALGSCRFKLNDIKEDDSQYQEIVDILHKMNIGYFVYIGGNDSMDTVAKLSAYCKEKGVEDIKVIGGPKTIDNDLCGIDHCPGFGSAAKYISTVFCELEQEITVYEPKNVIIVEMMGRHAGWLTAAAALAEGKNGNVPYLVYLEEKPFSLDRFIDDVKEKLASTNAVLVAVSEGVHDLLKKQNIVNLFACITHPNAESEAFHAARGYEKKAHFEQCGYKLGKWWDIVWMQKVIASNEGKPEPFQRFTGGF